MEILTIKEAKKAAWELVLTDDAEQLHLQDLYAKLEEQERKKRSSNDSGGKSS